MRAIFRGLNMRRTSQLGELVERARKHKMSPNERHIQRVSLVMGMRGRTSTLTREKVETILDEVEGHPA